MKPSDGDQTQCPCCKEYNDCKTGFQKVADLKKTGLVIYRHTTQTEDVNKDTVIVEFATKTTEDVFILHNIKNTVITPADYVSEIDQNTINCPRCRKIIEHAQKLLQNALTINKNDVKGICEHCTTKELPCSECEQAVNKFVAIKIEQAKYKREKVKQWLSRIKKLLKYAVDTETGQERVRAHSELYIDQLCREIPKPVSEPDVKQMFHPETGGSDFVGALPSSAKDRNEMFVHFPQQEKLITTRDHSVIFIDSLEKAEKAYISRTQRGIDIADRDKVYDSDIDSDEIKAMFMAPLTKKERPVELREHVLPVPFQSEVDVVEKDERPEVVPVDALGKHQKPNLKFDNQHSLNHLVALKRLHGKTSESPNTIRKYHSEEVLLTDIESVTEDVIRQDFNYVFPKTLPNNKNIKRQKSSSELIKDTRDMLYAKAKDETKRLEEERRNKLENEDIYKNARKEKRKESKKKAFEAIQKKDVVKEDKTKKYLDKQEKPTPTASETTTKIKNKESPLVPEKKDAKAKEPIEPKIDKNALKTEKAEKEKLKKEKVKQLQAEKETKQRERDLLKKQKNSQNKEKPTPKQIDLEDKAKHPKTNEADKKATKEANPLLLSVGNKESAAKQIHQEDKSKQANKNEADKRAREEARILRTTAKNAEAASEPENPKVSKKPQQTTTKDLNTSIKSVKVNKTTSDDLILQLVKLKQSTLTNRIKPKTLSEMKLTKKDVKTHRVYHKQTKTGTCFMCCDSDIELDAESLDIIKEKDEWTDIIIGPKISKYKPSLIVKQNEQKAPLFLKSTFDDSKDPDDTKNPVDTKDVLAPKIKPPVSEKHAEQDNRQGIIKYALSDRSFIDKGWTMLPTEKVVRKMNVYRMRPAQPQFDWFEHNKNRQLIEYDSGEKLAEFDNNGRGRWFYRNGRMALDYYNAEELNAQQRFVVYSSGEPDERGRAQPYTLLATFDYLGNGIVFDHRGKIRLKYNQTEGVILDRNIGPVSHWKWHTLNDPPVLEKVMIDTQMDHKDPIILKLGGFHDNKARPDNEDMLAIEFDNYIKEKSKKLSQSFKPFQIKMKALKINENFSLKVLDQATVYLIFRDGTTNMKLNIGMVLDHNEIVNTDTANVGQVSSNMERLPARTNSLAGLQKSIAHAQLYHRTRTERERRIRPTMPRGSVDKLVSVVSRPLRPPLYAKPLGFTTTSANCYCKRNRKPTPSNVYYDTRFC